MRFTSAFSLVLAVLVATALAATPAPCADQPPEGRPVVGSVSTIEGKAYLVRDGELVPLARGDRFRLHDTLVTPEGCAMGVIFRDDTTMALGPGTEVRIDEYVFNPADMELGFAAHMRTGTAQFITGQMARLAPEKMSVSTPLTTIGIRGTRFLVEVKEEQ